MPPPVLQAEKPTPSSAVPVACLRLRLPAKRSGVVPLAAGMPFPRGARRGLAGLAFAGRSDRALDVQWTPLAYWPDGSIKWALADFLAPPDLETDAELALVEAGAEAAGGRERLEVTESDGCVRVDTGAAVFASGRSSGRIDVELRTPCGPLLAAVAAELGLPGGRAACPGIREVVVESRGPVRATVRLVGEIESGASPGPFRFDCRASFFAGTGLVKLAVTLHNPWPARHPGGLWDLGDEGSLDFESLTLTAALHGAVAERLVWSAETGAPPVTGEAKAFHLHQASSGGENWRSRNHVDRTGQVRLPFRGYRLRADGTESTGLRASPLVALQSAAWRLGGAVEGFWQQFPKAIAAAGDRVELGLFPPPAGEAAGIAGVHELQGGERKTHHAAFCFEPAGSFSAALPLEWMREPARVVIDPEYIASTAVLGHLVPSREDPHDDYKALIAASVGGPSSFFAKREVIDEYGWRHFGDVYADHENTYAKSERPIASHYNNQYDLVYGFLVELARGGDLRWFELAQDLARHSADIDIYHTTLDKPVYNGGYFWHSDHYTDAPRATHRTYSHDSPQARSGSAYGGGPSNEQNYSSGLLLYHFLTGDPLAREAVLTLAQWVHDMDDGRKSILGALDSGPTGAASSTAEASYHGPGRGAGNSVRTLLNAFELTGDRRHLDKAEALIRRVIHPRDDLAARRLDQLEIRWSYLVFLQVLGKYLDVKSSLGERDDCWIHARHSLAHYVDWMLENEVPYAQALDRVEFPTETWPAHDIRKSVVFDYAAVYGRPGAAARCREQAERYFRECLAGVSAFETRTCARPLAILLQSGFLRAAFRLHPPPPEAWVEPAKDFGRPEPFIGQQERVKRSLKTAAGMLRAASLVLKPRKLARLVKAIASRR